MRPEIGVPSDLADDPVRPCATGSLPGWIRAITLCAGFAIGNTARAAEFGFETLRNLVDTRGINSVEGLIEALPQDLRTHYALMFTSRSLQGANLANPRAILFGSDAEFIVTFNGDPAVRGYSAVETMQFDPRKNEFQFREIQFPVAKGASVVISEPNSARCLACHGQPARPIWDMPPSWPGAYGERYGAGLSPKETAGIREFLALQPVHARYRNLLGAAAFADRETYVSSAHAMYNGVRTISPNAQLSVLLTNLNYRMIMSEIASRPAFDAHRYALLAAAEGSCGPLPDYYPASVRAAIAVDLRAFKQSSAATERLQAAAIAARLAGAAGGYQQRIAVGGLDKLRFVVEHSLDLATRQWTLALEANTYDLSAPEGAHTLAQMLFEQVARTDEALRGLRADRSFSSDDRYCEHLRRHSVRALEAWYLANPLQLTPTDDGWHADRSRDAASAPLSTAARPELLDRCAGCHTGVVAPYIPFADPDALGKQLGHGNYRHGRLLDEILYRLAPEAGATSMPLGIAISEAQRHGLDEYFLGLARRADTQGDN